MSWKSNLLSLMLLFSRSIVPDSLCPHGLQHARLPRLSPRVCSNSCPLSQWCHPNISSSVTPFSSCLQSFPASGSFPVSQLFASGGQSIGASASASVLPMNIQDWFPLGWTGWISLQSKGLSRVFNTTVQKHQFFRVQPSLWSNSHVCTWLMEKQWLWLYEPLSAKWCLFFIICCLACHSFSSKEQVCFNFMVNVEAGKNLFQPPNTLCLETIAYSPCTVWYNSF